MITNIYKYYVVIRYILLKTKCLYIGITYIITITMKGHNYGICRKCGKIHIVNCSSNTKLPLHAEYNNDGIFNRKVYKSKQNEIYRKHNKEYFQKYISSYNREIFIKVISHYSHNTMKCFKCGEDRIFGLSIDHINSNGKEHRKIVKHLYPWLIKNNFPDGYQVLCMNCQFEKAMINGENNLNKKPTEQQIKIRNKNDKCEDKIKWEALSIYSNSSIPYCGVCHTTNIWHLCLDHVDGDGAVDRMKYNNIRGTRFYRKLKQEGYPNKDKYQVLCETCNRIKQRENNENPNLSK